MLIWNDNAEKPRSTRYLVMAAFLVGLSTGVHLMSVLAIAAVVMVVVLRRSVSDDDACRKSAYVLLLHIVIILLVAAGMWANLTSAQPPTPDEYHQYDSNFKLVMAAISALFVALFWKRVFHRNSFYLAVAAGGAGIWNIYPCAAHALPALLLQITGPLRTAFAL